MSTILFTGGARSGKSTLAQAWCAERSGPRHYLATAHYDADDAEMAARIARHRQERSGRGWTTVEVDHDLCAAIPTAGVALIDCLTLWLAGRAIALDWDAAAVLDEVDQLCAVVAAPSCDLAIVTNEVGSGIVPEQIMGRRFRDLQGWANQRVAGVAQEVVLCVCGLPMRVKPCAR
jgi:adenosylcobinamide kinase / adenosylcobinamide-phosphate guanylyltransferase